MITILSLQKEKAYTRNGRISFENAFNSGIIMIMMVIIMIMIYG